MAQLAEQAAQSLGDDVQEALALLRSFMRNPKLSARLRKDCAVELLDRAIGRPTQHKVVDKKRVWSVRFDDGDFADLRDNSAPPALEADGDMAESGEAQGDSVGETVGQDDAGQ